MAPNVFILPQDFTSAIIGDPQLAVRRNESQTNTASSVRSENASERASRQRRSNFDRIRFVDSQSDNESYGSEVTATVLEQKPMTMQKIKMPTPETEERLLEALAGRLLWQEKWGKMSIGNDFLKSRRE